MEQLGARSCCTHSSQHGLLPIESLQEKMSTVHDVRGSSKARIRNSFWLALVFLRTQKSLAWALLPGAGWGKAGVWCPLSDRGVTG